MTIIPLSSLLNKTKTEHGTDWVYNEYLVWLKKNEVRYGEVNYSKWTGMPEAITMSDEDALAFKLKFGL